jgi:hypothetical protein
MNNAVNLFPTPSAPCFFSSTPNPEYPNPSSSQYAPTPTPIHPTPPNRSKFSPPYLPFSCLTCVFSALSTFFLSYLCFFCLIYLFPTLSMFFLPYLCFPTLSVFSYIICVFSTLSVFFLLCLSFFYLICVFPPYLPFRQRRETESAREKRADRREDYREDLWREGDAMETEVYREWYRGAVP